MTGWKKRRSNQSSSPLTYGREGRKTGNTCAENPNNLSAITWWGRNDVRVDDKNYTGSVCVRSRRWENKKTAKRDDLDKKVERSLSTKRI